MKSLIGFASVLALTQALAALPASSTTAPATQALPASRLDGPCDIYARAGTPCAAAHSSTRALYAGYNGPLYQVMRQSDGKTLDIGVAASNGHVKPVGARYADADAQDRFCADTYCWIAILYDQSGHHNDLVQPPRGTWSGPAQAGVDTLPLADMAPISVMGHKVYGVFIAPGMGLRLNDAKGTAVDDQAQGQYWVINGQHFNSGCCFDYGNAEIDSRDDDNGTMEATFYGNTPWWYHGRKPGPWIMTDQENNLVGCVNDDKTNLCKDLPSVTSRFVTAMAKGRPGHWTTLGGDARHGPLSVMFDGRRIDASYDPMRKQGAILLGNGGDNSNDSQGTFYEGVMTAGGTFPSDATDQLIQANVVAAHYNVAPVVVSSASGTAAPSRLQTFSSGSPQDVTVTFTNTTGEPITGLNLALQVPRGWKAFVSGSMDTTRTIETPLQPGASVATTFTVTSAPSSFEGDLSATASWPGRGRANRRSEAGFEKVRNTAPVKINEFRIQDGTGRNRTNSFVELYNSGAKPVDLSNWTLDAHPTLEVAAPRIVIPAGTTLPAHRFYVLGLSDSGLTLPARTGERTLSVRNVDGMTSGDTITIGTGRDQETRRIAKLGTATGKMTSVWQPLPDGIITVPPGSTNIPVSSVAGITMGDRIALGYGTTFPIVGRTIERYETVTVTAVGTGGNQAYVALDAPAGSANIQVTSVDGISKGDRIRLDIDSVGHGIETVTVKHVGTIAKRSTLSATVPAGTTTLKVHAKVGFPAEKRFDYATGAEITVGSPADLEQVRIAAVELDGDKIVNLQLAAPLARAHVANEPVVEPGTGLELAAPLKFAHAANLPFSVRGSGISFSPATRFPHSSDEPVVLLGTGIELDAPLQYDHSLDDVVRDADAVSVGFQGKPNQWFGGPALSPGAGSLVLRDAQGHVADSLNYGRLVDPWAAEGDQGRSGFDIGGCSAPVPGIPYSWTPVDGLASDASTGRFPDGKDSDNNCSDLVTAAATTVAGGAPKGATNVKVNQVADFAVGQTVYVGSGLTLETGTIAMIGTAGATRTSRAYDKGATTLDVEDAGNFTAGQAVTIGKGPEQETATISSANHWDSPNRIVLEQPLGLGHPVGSEVSGTGLGFTSPLTFAHDKGAPIETDTATPGAPNAYSRKPHS